MVHRAGKRSGWDGGGDETGLLEAIIHGDHLKPKEIVEKQRYFLAEVSNFESNLREDG